MQTIAYVTVLLKRWLEYGLIEASVPANVGADIQISALPPDRIAVGPEEPPRLNLFLHQVTPNTRLRTGIERERDIGGESRDDSAPDLILYYLLTAYGEQDIQTELLLGYAVQRMHGARLLTFHDNRWRGARTQTSNSGIEAPVFPAHAQSPAARQIGQITIEPQFLSSEELSRLWSALQARYRLSVAYKVSPLPPHRRGP